MTRFRDTLALVGLIFVLTLVFVVPVLASDGEMPWDSAVLVFGGVAVGVGLLVQALVQVLKAIQINGKPLLPTEGSIHIANALLGGLLFMVANVMAGTHIAAALLQSLIAFGMAIAGHDIKDFLVAWSQQRSSKQPEDPPSNPDITESPADGQANP